MRKIALAVAAAMLVAAPVTAEEVVEEPVPTAPCEAPGDGVTALGLDGHEQDVLAPLVPSAAHHELGEPYPAGSFAEYQYRVDLSGSEAVPTAKSGNVVIDVGWNTDGDYDVYVYNATTGASLGEGTSFNPQTGGGETITLSRTAHCTDIRIQIVNYAGAASEMTLGAAISALKA